MKFSFNYRRQPSGCPCERNCPDREVGCHGKCERYLEWRKKVDELNAQRRKEQDVENHISMSVQRTMWKYQRYPSRKKHYRDYENR